MAEHTPVPWKTETTALGGRERTIITAGDLGTDEHLIGAMYGTLPPGAPEANAEFIVRAVNVHDELLAALEAVVASDAPPPGKQWDSNNCGMCDTGRHSIPGSHHDDCPMPMVRAAIAKAKGGG